MIKFTDNAFVGGQFFTPGMLAQFDTVTEQILIDIGDAELYVIEASGSVNFAANAGNALTANSATTAGHANIADIATTATTANNAGHATTADSATTATSATSASHATTADSATFATTASSAGSATTANTANTADSATTAGHATTADSATNAGHATTADSATTAGTAGSATSADSATNADHATLADSATIATTAISATTATSATSATKANALILPGTTQLGYATAGNPVDVLSSSAVAVSCTLTAVDEVLASFTILAGTLGVNSILQIEPLWTYTNSANNKTFRIKIASATIYNTTKTTTSVEGPLIILANRNSLQSQIIPYDYTYFINGTYTPPTYSIDFSNNVTIQFIGQRTNSGESLTLEYYRVLHFVGA